MALNFDNNNAVYPGSRLSSIKCIIAIAWQGKVEEEKGTKLPSSSCRAVGSQLGWLLRHGEASNIKWKPFHLLRTSFRSRPAVEDAAVRVANMQCICLFIGVMSHRCNIMHHTISTICP
ncbi:uncharacterized protein BDCG_00589 [Blastomyces dermatitidis ER-3]|uniref:Uncharacterized protein n=1 Tax=Ajellomyces dermatitidis (strain ER-3 / ATCC MYA-2586) TaxID=559297 RepID=A0ABP2ELY3_AJEDR|nr:uncharacterized protein BDCG_00589 [Blastomyces dermatitidis ER-3]EEQ83784.2 hypothetical protein BDCG_00589 [Blastomyces dermatitidis ER-3]